MSQATAALKIISSLPSHGGTAMDRLVWTGATPLQDVPAPIPALSTGLPALDAALALSGLSQGAVTEFRSRPGMGALSLAMHVCAHALRQDPHALCAVVDGPGTLHAPAVLEAGVPEGRMWCVRPQDASKASQLALRLCRSGGFKVVVVDQSGQAPMQPELAVRRLALAAQESGCVVLWLSGPWTQLGGLPLPVAARLGVARRNRHTLDVHVDKQRGSARESHVLLPWPLRGNSISRLGHIPVLDVPPPLAMERPFLPLAAGSP